MSWSDDRSGVCSIGRLDVVVVGVLLGLFMVWLEGGGWLVGTTS